MVEKENTSKSTGQVKSPSLLLWPGVLLVAFQWLLRFVVPNLFPDPIYLMIGIMGGGLLGGLLIALWWMFFSRAPRIERFGAIGLIVVALVFTSFFLDESIATANMGLMFAIYSIPVMCLAFVGWALATRTLCAATRRVSMVVTILLASGVWLFLRTDGMHGDARQDLNWRWAQTHEQQLLSQFPNDSQASNTSPAVESHGDTLAGRSSAGVMNDSTAQISAASQESLSTTLTNAAFVPQTSTQILPSHRAEWLGFRGAARDGIVRGVKIRTNWSAVAPHEMWRRPIGPGCSSFAVRGTMLYTQEQRGEFETVSCYNLTTGKSVWEHRDSARFYDSHAGAGPRSTPTLVGDCVYTLGATGILNALKARDGSVIWSRKAAIDAGIKVPGWGFASSPLVVDDLVIVALAGKLAAYDIQNGKPTWSGPDGGSSYSSPQLLTLDSLPQVLLMSKAGAISVEPANGKKYWDYPFSQGDRILQPAFIEKSELLLCSETKNVRRVSVERESDSLTIKERWTSTEMNVNFNDLVVHKGFAYGFDGPCVACLDLATGKRVWKGNRYQGFLLLLADQDLLLILSESGELVLVPAVPDKFLEVARFPAIKGKTWSHPVLVGNVVVVRNAMEMAAFRL